MIPQLIVAANTVRKTIGLSDEGADVVSVKRMLQVARHIAAAPPAAPETFTAAAWDHGVEQAIDLVDAVASFEAAHREVGDKLSDAAWEADCAALRQTLAMHGRGLLRWLSARWRQSNRVAKSLLRNPAAPVPEVLSLLEQVAKGQKARAIIQQGNAFGSSAFGLQWRGERSNSAPLRAVAEWARSLGPRSREVRELAARVSDTAQVRVDVSCLEAIWTEFETLLSGVSAGLNHASQSNAEQIGLEDLKQRTAEIVAAEKTCREVFRCVPDLVSERAQLFSDLNAWRLTEKALGDNAQLGQQCFGALWKGADSDWPALAEAAKWVSLNGEIRHVAARFDRPEEPLIRSNGIGAHVENMVSGANELFRDLQLDTDRLFGSNDVRDICLADLTSRLDRWAASREDLSNWVAYAGRVKQARRLGVGEAADRLESGELHPAHALIEVEKACYWAVLASIARDSSELARFDGAVRQGYVDEFARLEGEHKLAARIGATRAHYRRIPHGGVGPVGVLKAEIARRRGHMPIRQLMSHAGAAIQALKPVIMMSPLSVAQFLTPGELKFDMLVMDEASQIQPVEALGAVARCRQAIVVGDERQLPPTRFFARMTAGQADDEDAETAQVADVESILGLFLAGGAPQRTLRWHYRSEHHSLIAVSNSEFYDNKLCILPSPYTNEAGRGIRFHHVPEGIYDSGNTRANGVEAQRVAEAVMEHARLHPGQTLVS